MTAAKRRVRHYGGLIRTFVYSLASLLFIAAYFYNEHLRKINLDRYAAPDYHYDYHLQESGTFIFAMIITLVLMATMDWSLKNPKNNRFKNRKPLVAVALLFYLAILVCLFDMSFGGWGVPGRCGRGFEIGNCFLMDGLAEMVYLVVIPVMYLFGTILLIINKKTKSRMTN